MRILSRTVFWAALFCLISVNFIYASEKIDINTAPLEDLVKIVHIGEVRALELISLRPFASVDDLIRIKGVGETRIKDIKKQGLAWVGPLNTGGADVGGEASNMLEVRPPIFETENVAEAKEASPQSVEAKPQISEPRTNSGLAAVGQPATQKSSFVLLIAGVIALFSGIIVLLLKKGLK